MEIIAEVTFLGANEGGRPTPPRELSSGQYRPHLVTENIRTRLAEGTRLPPGVSSEHYMGVQFCTGPDEPSPGNSFEATLKLLYYPQVDYSALIGEASFTVREGGHVVGYGKVIRGIEARTA